jgi:cytidylate kinase
MCNSSWVVLVSGPIRSGKSTVAVSIADVLDARRVGFGDAVRERVRQQHLPDRRRNWQQVGEQWVDADPAGLCDVVLAPVLSSARIVVDGVRHETVLSILRARFSHRRLLLVYVHAGEETLRHRLAADGLDSAAVDDVLYHSTEYDLPGMRAAADVVVDGEQSVDVALRQLKARLIG